MEALLGHRRLRVGSEPERGFRIEGELELALELRTARDPSDLRAVRFGGSGGVLLEEGIWLDADLWLPVALAAA